MRCSLARTLTLKPPLFLFDEPFGAVDEITREHLNDETQRLFEPEGFAGLFITHSISEAVFLEHPRAGDVRPARAASSPSSPCRSRTRAPRPALRARVRRSSAASSRTPCEVRTHERRRRSTRDRRRRAPSRRRRADRPTRRRRRSSRAASAHIVAVALPPLVLGLVVIGFWYFISYVMLSRTPALPAARRRTRWSTSASSTGTTSTRSSTGSGSATKVALIGLAISIVLGMLIAVLMSQAKMAERAIFPYMVTLQAIPILAIVPLIGFWFGYGLKSRVFVCVIISIFPIIVNTLFGLQSADRGHARPVHAAPRQPRRLGCAS